VLVRLLGNSELRPLLSMSGEKSSLLTAYLALKRLLRKGRLEPTILNMMVEDGQGTSAATVAQALRDCARNFLAYEPHAIRIDPAQTPAQLDAAMRRLATRLLENAMTLQSEAPTGDRVFAMPAGLAGYRELSRSH
jgi:hypothetical protein